jgi:hypothetical protein
MQPTPAPRVDPATLPETMPENVRRYMLRPRMLLGGLPPHHSRRAVDRSLRMMLQAHRAFEATAARLQRSGWIDPSGEREHRRLHVRDPEDARAIFVRPMLALRVAGGIMTGPTISTRPEGEAPVVPIDAPEGWLPGQPYWDLPEPPADVIPKGADMHGGQFRIADGEAYYAVRYDAKGVKFETSERGGDHMAAYLFGATRPWQLDPTVEPPQAPPIRLLLRDDLDVQGWPTERLAEALARLADGNHTPARVLLPEDLPGGVVGCWHRAQEPLRRWLWQQPPEWHGWVAIDGLDGSAIGHGASREQAERACRAAIATAQPRHTVAPPMDPAQIQADLDAQQADRDRAVAHLRRLRAIARGESVVSLEDRHIDATTGLVKNRRGETVGFGTPPITLTVRGAHSPIGWPEPTPETTPIILLPIPAAAAMPDRYASAGFDGRHRVVGDEGAVGTLFVRAEAETLVAVGADVAAAVSPLLIEATRA